MQLDISSARPSASASSLDPASRVAQSATPSGGGSGVRVSIPSPTTESPAIQRPVSAVTESAREEASAEADPASPAEFQPSGAPAESMEMGDREALDRPEAETSQRPDTQSAQQAQLRELQLRDREIRQNELAHQVVGGRYADLSQLSFERGPDGQLYAISGDVSLDTAPVADDAQATIDKMRVVRAAALAPANPSPEDIRIALEAMRQMLEAQAELRGESLDDVREVLEQSSASINERSLEVFREVARAESTNRAVDGGARLDTTA